MKSHTLAGRNISVEPRSTAYYYADLEKLKKPRPEIEKDIQNELSEYVESNEVVNDGAVREIPPFRDRQFSLPEYHTPENGRKIEETYSTAGTFPMPEPKEKEPLLAELEVVGRLPLTQLDSSPGVRRSRSWYLCCPNVGEEEISRESSWRYSSLRPVTAPPVPGQNGFSQMVASQSSGHEDVTSLRAERDALARALAAERQRAATAARAHDARLAELHGVIAELVRRRAAHKQSAAIPEEELSDECESTTQPAGELDNDADHSRTEQNDTSSALSPCSLPTPHEPAPPAAPAAPAPPPLPNDRIEANETSLEAATSADTSLHLSRASDLGQDVHRSSCEVKDDSEGSAVSCEREHGSPAVYTPPVGSGGARGKLAWRVRLRRAADSHENHGEHAWCGSAGGALDLSAQADFREALASVDSDEDDCIWRLRWLRSEASLLVSRGALSRCGESARRLHCACAQLEASTAAVMAALAAADRALETYDVLLALAETQNTCDGGRAAAEAVAWRLLRRLSCEKPAQRSPQLSPGPWLQDEESPSREESAPLWTARQEAQLRAHCAALKAQTVALRQHAHNPMLFAHHDIDEEDLPSSSGIFSMADMEAAVMLEEMLAVRVSNMERRPQDHTPHKGDSTRSRRRRERQWRPHTSETDL